MDSIQEYFITIQTQGLFTLLESHMDPRGASKRCPVSNSGRSCCLDVIYIKNDTLIVRRRCITINRHSDGVTSGRIDIKQDRLMVCAMCSAIHCKPCSETPFLSFLVETSVSNRCRCLKFQRSATKTINRGIVRSISRI